MTAAVNPDLVRARQIIRDLLSWMPAHAPAGLLDGQDRQDAALAAAYVFLSDTAMAAAAAIEAEPTRQLPARAEIIDCLERHARPMHVREISAYTGLNHNVMIQRLFELERETPYVRRIRKGWYRFTPDGI